MTSKAFIAGLAGSLLFILTTIIGGALHPGYSHVSQFISELYAVNAPHADALRFAGYVPAGMLLAVFSFSSRKLVPSSTNSSVGFAGLGIFYGLFTIVASIFNCDEGCNKKMIDPSVSQIIHSTSGLLTYLIVPACIILLGREAWKWENGRMVSWFGLASGLLAVCFVIVLLVRPESAYAGLIQRAIEPSILSWVIVCANYLRR